MDKNEVKSASKTLFFLYFLILLGGSYLFKEKLLSFSLNGIFGNGSSSKIVANNKESNIFNIKGLLTESDKVKKVEGFVLDRVKGNVSYKRKGRISKLTEKFKVKSKDVIITAEKSFVGFAFGPLKANKVIVGPSSIVRVDSFFFRDTFKRKDSKLFLHKGKVLSILSNLLGTEYNIDTRFCSFGVRGTEFLVSVNDKGDSLISVVKGEVEGLNAVTKKKVSITPLRPMVFTEKGVEYPILKPEFIEKVKKEFKENRAYKFKKDKTSYEEFFEQFDTFKLNHRIQARINDMIKYYNSQVSLDKTRYKIFEEDVELRIKELDKFEREIIADKKCLKSNAVCTLNHDDLLLKKGLVMTSGLRRYNKQSSKYLDIVLKERSAKVEKRVQDLKKFKDKMAQHKNFRDRLIAIEGEFFAEDIVIRKPLRRRIYALNKEIEDNDLSRFIKEAGWEKPD